MLALAVGLAGQSDWRLTSAAVAPPAREDHAMTTDPARGEVLLFGGRAVDGNLLGDTWTWDGTAWTRRTVTGPPVRRAAALAFHAPSGRAVLFGGYDTRGTALADTWEWDGSAWIQAFPATAPGARAAAAMAGDTAGGLVLFGGADAAGSPSGETWLWDGTTWSRHGAAPEPSPRFGHAMTRDPAGGVLLYGGFGAGADTWRFTAGAWTQLAPANDPGPRQRHDLALDPVRDRAVLHGGTDGVAFAVTETWEWDGAEWVQRAPADNPSPRVDAAMAFDPIAERCVLLGGYDGVAALGDVWSYGATFPASVETYGSGCAGSSGTPSMRADAGLPWLGDTFAATVTDLPPNRPAQMHAGFSDTVWNGLPLPFALDPVGMPGCSILASIDAIAPLQNLGGVAELVLPVPVDQNLLGLGLYLQALAFDPGANALGAIVSDGLRFTIGGR